MSYDVGEAFIQLVPSFSGVVEKISAESAKWGTASGKAYAEAFKEQTKGLGTVGPSATDAAKQGAQAGGAFSDAFKAKVTAALKSLPAVNITADSSEADRKIAAVRADLESLSGKRVGVDISDADAIAKLLELKARLAEIGASSPSAQVKVDTLAASAKLAEFQAEMSRINGETAHAKVDVDSSGAAGALSGMFSLSTAVIGLGPALVPIGAAAIGAIGGIASAAVAAAAGVGVLALAFSGVSNAVKLLGQLQTAQAADAQQAAARHVVQAAAERAASNQLVSAEASLANARRTAADAAVSADEQVRNSQQALADAETAAARQRVASAEAVANAKRSLADAERQQAQQTITSNEQIANAEQSLQDVERQVAAGRIQAARQVATAEQALTDANKAAASAQKALNDAREQAARDLEDSANRQTDAQLAAQQATLDYAQQQMSTAKVLGSSTSTDLEKQQAVLSLAESHQRLTEAQQESQRATEDNTKAQAGGVNGNSGVVSAQQQVIDATNQQKVAQQNLADAIAAQQKQQMDGLRQIAKAEQALADAERSAANQRQASAEQVAKAEQGVADALRSQKQSAEDSAKQIAKAQQGIADAERSRAQSASSSAASVASAQRGVKAAMDAVAKAAEGSGSAGESALAKIKAQLAKVSPDVLTFAKYWRDQVTPQFKNLQDAAAKGLLPGVTQFFKDIKPLMPGLTQFIGDVAAAMGDLFKQAGQALTAPFWKQFFTFLDDTVGQNLTTLGTAFGDIAEGLAGLFEALAPVGTDVLNGFLDFARSFADWATHLSTNKGFQTFLKYVTDNMPTVMDLLGGLFKILGSVIRAFAPFGAILLQIVDAFVQMIAKLPPDELLALVGELAALVAVLASGPAAFIGAALAVVAISGAIIDFVANNKAFHQVMKDIWQGIRDAVEGTWRDVLKPTFHFIVKAWDDVTGAFAAAYHWVTDVFTQHWGQVADIMAAPVKAGWKEIVRLWDDVKTAFSDAWHWVERTFSSLWNGVKQIITGPINDAVKDIHDFFGSKGPVRSAFNDVWAWVSTVFSKLWDGVKTIFTDPVQAAKNVFNNLFGEGGSVRKIFSGAVSAIGKIWSGLRDLFAAPIKFVIDTVLNGGIIKAWNWVADHLHLKSLKVDPIPDLLGNATQSDSSSNRPVGVFAAGGIIPGYAPGRDSVVAMLSPGEGILRPEVVKALGHDTIHAWNRAAVSGAMPRFAGGGIFGGIANLAGDVWSGAKSAGSALWGGAKDLADLLKAPVEWLVNKIKAPLSSLASIEDSDFGKLVGQVPRKLGSTFVDTLKGFIGLGSGSSGGGSAPTASGPVTQFAGVVRQVLAMLGLHNPADVNGILSLIQHESSGSVNNVNRWDSNWTAGHPSVGLMQVIRGTFDEWAGPFKNTGPFLYGVSTDPLANIYAGVNYALHRYGEGMLAAGGRHDASGNYIGYDSGGWLPPGMSTVVNATGKPEPILTSQQWADINASRNSGSVATLSGFDRDLLMAVARRPVQVQVGQREIATSVNDYRLDRVAHGETGWS